jgi:hypothetical protein
MAHGTHSHAALYREEMVTSADGQHTHVFTLPDGSKVETEPGGAHAHVLDRDEANYVSGGSHTHRVVVGDDEYYTDIDGWHSHELGVDSVPDSGLHSHYLWHESGAVILSEMPGDVAKGEKRKREKPAPRDLDSGFAAASKALETLRTLATVETVKAAATDEPDAWKWADTEDLSPPVATTITSRTSKQ